MPDETLFEAAESGELETEEGLEAHARRLLSDLRARAAIADFHSQWLGTERLEETQKCPLLFEGLRQRAHCTVIRPERDRWPPPAAG